jgi:hypothetical protein
MVDQSVTGVRIVDSSSFKKNVPTNDFTVLYRIELWFDNTAKRSIIEEKFKNILSIDDPKAIYYKTHN